MQSTCMKKISPDKEILEECKFISLFGQRTLAKCIVIMVLEYNQ